jgi:N-methylhydantoinase A
LSDGGAGPKTGTVRLGIDVGGTFTDIVAIGEDGDTWLVRKVPSTPSAPDVAVLRAIELMLADLGEAEVVFVGHGTTAGTNAFLTKRGATTSLLTTKGFEDVLEFRRMDRTGVLDPYDLQLQFPEPLVPARRRVGVDERIGVGGEVVHPLADDEIARVVDRLREDGAEAVAVSLLWSFENPEHEIRLRDALAEQLPDVFVTCSVDVDPSMLEYERTSTTVVNAYLGPLINRYFTRVERGIAGMGLPKPLIMQSNGGLASISEAARRPAALLESGPAAGVAACGYLAQQKGIDHALAVDMGGTSFDVALIIDGQPMQNIETEVDGYVIRLPMLDIRSIGAGGGSIAWVDDAGALRVGPQSAGSEPGPVCYGRGGTLPTVSDANAVLGYLQDLTGGSLVLDVDAARRAIDEHIGRPLGLSTLDAASGVIRLVNANMADAMRLIMSERAISPAELTVIAYGGAGPVHAAALARELDIPRTLVPRHPGALSALGVATGDLVHDFVSTVLLPLDVIDPNDLAAAFHQLGERARDVLGREGCIDADISLQPYVLARYIGQMHDLEVHLPPDELTGLQPDKLAEQFHARHHERYGIAVEDEPVFVVSARLKAVGRIRKPEFAAHTGSTPIEPVRMVSAWFAETGTTDVPLYARTDWPAGEVQAGPAIIQEYDSTTLVLPGQTWHNDKLGSLIIEER